MVPKAPETSEMSETFQGISSDIAPNGYKGFGANPRQDWVQEKGGGRLRNPVLYPPELQGQELPKALPTKSLQRSRRMSLHGQSARLPPKRPNCPHNSPLFDLQSTPKRRSSTGYRRSGRLITAPFLCLLVGCYVPNEPNLSEP